MILRAWDYGSNITKSCNCKGDHLEKEVYEVVVLSIEEIVTSTEEQKCCESQLQQKNSEIVSNKSIYNA